MAILILLLLELAVVGMAGVLGSLNAYQAVTGRRLSKSPSRRTEKQMRIQSAIAAVALLGLACLLLLYFVLLAFS